MRALVVPLKGSGGVMWRARTWLPKSLCRGPGGAGVGCVVLLLMKQDAVIRMVGMMIIEMEGWIMTRLKMKVRIAQS